MAAGESINLTECGLVVIDVDRKSFERNLEQAMKEDASRGSWLAERTRDAALPNLARLLNFFRERRRPVVFIQWGWHKTQYPELLPRDGEDVVIKQSRGAFSTSNLHDILQKHAVRTCIVTGADTAICVTSTVCGAIDRGYRAVLVDDACVCVNPDMHNTAMRLMHNMGARVMTTDEVLSL